MRNVRMMSVERILASMPAFGFLECFMGLVLLPLTIFHTRLLLLFPQLLGNVKPVINTEIEDEDVFTRVDAEGV